MVVEGNQLLHDCDGSERVRPLLDERRFLEVDARYGDRAVARHIAHGLTPHEAERRVTEVDETDAELIRRTAHRPGRVVTRDLSAGTPRPDGPTGTG